MIVVTKNSEYHFRTTESGQLQVRRFSDDAGASRYAKALADDWHDLQEAPVIVLGQGMRLIGSSQAFADYGGILFTTAVTEIRDDA